MGKQLKGEILMLVLGGLHERHCSETWNSPCIPQRDHNTLPLKDQLLKLFKEVIADYSENLTKHIQNAALLIVKYYGTYSDH
jgi:hypothetical protein